jgi:hypothetical protein
MSDATRTGLVIDLKQKAIQAAESGKHLIKISILIAKDLQAYGFS